MSKQTVSDADFVTKYMECKSYDELGLALAMKSVAARANRLRKAGVNLPKYAREKKAVDVAGLNALIGK